MDLADAGNIAAEVFFRESVSMAAVAARKLPATGECYNCTESVDGDKNFCDAACREDWERRVKMGRINGC